MAYSNYTDSDYITGWVTLPDTRGTIDILWSCVFTVFLASWTVLCLNLPAREDNRTDVFLRKLRWMFTAILGPEIVLANAFGDYESARRGVRDFKKEGHPHWTIRHAFFADMGGFLLCPKHNDKDDDKVNRPFPVNNKHLLWLTKNNFLKFPTAGWVDTYPELRKQESTRFPMFQESEIWDRSKADVVIKAINFLQIGWLLLNVIARKAQGIAITTLELGAAANATASVVTVIVWKSKPTDVATPIRIEITATVDEILERAACEARDRIRNANMANDAQPHATDEEKVTKSPIHASETEIHDESMEAYSKVKAWQMTPLDFVDNMLPSCSVNVGSRLGLTAGIETGPEKGPLPRFPNDRFPHVRGLSQVILVIVTLLAASIHLCGWNFPFPTPVEQILWRIAAIIMFGTGGLFWLAEVVAVCKREMLLEIAWCKLFNSKGLKEVRRKKALQPEEPVFTRESFPEKWELVFAVALCTVYMVARFYAIAEMFVGLRYLPASAYQSVSWVKFIPHIF